MADTKPGDGKGSGRGNVENLRRAVAERAKWGTSGDFTRCHLFLTSKGVSDDGASRICAQWHKDNVGFYPGDKRNQ